MEQEFGAPSMASEYTEKHSTTKNAVNPLPKPLGVLHWSVLSF